MRRTRGSAMFFTLILAIAATTAVMTIANLAFQNAKQQSTRERDFKVRMAIEGVLAKVEQSFGDKTISLGTNTTYTLNGVTWTANTVDYSATKAKSYKVTITGTVDGASYSRAYVIGNPYERGPLHFALWTGRELKLDQALITSTTTPSNVFVDGDLDVSASGCTIGGNVEITGVVKGSKTATYLGTLTTGAALVPSGTVSAATYLAAATNIYVLDSATNANFSPDYRLIYHTGNFTFRGSVTGKGTMFITGDLTIDGNVVYTDSNSMIAFIVQGKITIKGSVGSLPGIYYAGGKITVEGAGSTLCNQAILIANSDIDLKGPLTITTDDRIEKDQQLGYDMRLPRYWP